MDNPKYPPMTIEVDVYYYEDEDTGKMVFDEEEMLRAYENKVNELKNKYSQSEE